MQVERWREPCMLERESHNICKIYQNKLKSNVTYFEVVAPPMSRGMLR